MRGAENMRRAEPCLRNRERPNLPQSQPYGVGHKLIGKNYTTPDLSPRSRARRSTPRTIAPRHAVLQAAAEPGAARARRSIDTARSAGDARREGDPHADDLPAPADSLTDNGTVIRGQQAGRARADHGAGVSGRADSRGRRRGRTDRRRSHREDSTSIIERCRSWSIRSMTPAARRPERAEWRQRLDPADPPAAAPGQPPPHPPAAKCQELKWTEADFADAKDGQMPMGKPADEWSYGDVDAGFKNAALVLDETFVTPDTSHQTLETRTAMAYWQNGKVYVHTGTQSTAQTVPAIARWLNIGSEQRRAHQRIHRRRIRQQDHRRDFADHSGAAVEESQRAGDDAHQPRRRALHRPRAAQPAGPHESRIHQGRPDHRPRHVRHLQQRPVRRDRAMPRHRAASFRCCISRRPCAGAA